MSAIITAASPIVLALITAIVTPLMVAIVLNRTKAVDWARQDQVAEQVRLVAAQAAEAAKLLVSAQTDVSNRLTVIHTLVNSNMTAAMQDSLDSTIREKAALLELSASRRDLGKEPTTETLAAIETADRKIAEIKATLEDRRKAVF